MSNIDIEAILKQNENIKESFEKPTDSSVNVQNNVTENDTTDIMRHTTADVNDRGDGSVPVIELKHITHIFNEGQPNEYRLFEDFNLVIPDIPNQGQLVSIMGASGCGKSQLLKVIAGLNRFDKGNVEVYGKEIDENHSFPMVFQNYSNYTWYTVLENVMLPMKLRGINRATAETRAKELLECVGMLEHADKYPNQLSGGQQQRVAIASCLASEAQVILFDEATGALDIKMKREVQNIILKIFYEMKMDPTIINVSHSVEEVCYISNKVFIFQAKPCRVFKEIDIHYPGEDTRPRGEWVLETPEYANYVKQVNEYLSGACI